MQVRNIVIIVILIMSISNVLWGGSTGTTNANFLKTGQGVKPIAMGETYVALGKGLDTLYWNPAGLLQLKSPELTLLHSFWLQDTSIEYVAFGMPLNVLGSVGVGITVVNSGWVERTLENNSGEYAGVAGEELAMSFAFVGAYSQKLSHLFFSKNVFLENVLLGISFRGVAEYLEDANIFGGGIDVGAIWRQKEEIIPTEVKKAQGKTRLSKVEPIVRDKGWRLGVVAQNLGLTSDNWLPMNFRLGAGYIIPEFLSSYDKATLLMDVLLPIDSEIKLSLGGEYNYIMSDFEITARGGYKIGNEINELDYLAGLTAGAGLAIRVLGIRYYLDYVFVPYGSLGSTHRASLTLEFFPSERAITAKRKKRDSSSKAK